MVWCEYEMSLPAHALEPRPLGGGGVVLFGEVLEMLRGGTLLRKYVTGREYLGVTSLWPFLLQ